MQPFLEHGWTVYKMRYGIDNTGKREGLRIIVCVDAGKKNLLMIQMCKKANCPDEGDLRVEINHRIATYLAL